MQSTDDNIAGTDPYALAANVATELQRLTNVDAYDVAVVLGSGWSTAADALGDVVADVEMSNLPGFAPPSVPGHLNLARSVVVDHRQVLVLGGRAHLYEGQSAAAAVHGIRMAAAAGCRAVMLTNAAGSLQPEWSVGQAVLISDHLNLTGQSPMVGPAPPDGYPGRFCDLTETYSSRLRAIAREIDPDIPEGVYAGLLGGNFETPAEIAMLATLGADLVGMSTVLEAIAARHLGLDVLGVSLVTNLAAGLAPAELSHADVLAAATEAGDRMVRLIRGVLENLWSSEASEGGHGTVAVTTIREPDPAVLAQNWMAVDPDAACRLAIEQLLADPAELERRFGDRLAFGTAGLRGELGAGPMRMNEVLVRLVAAALAARVALIQVGAW